MVISNNGNQRGSSLFQKKSSLAAGRGVVGIWFPHDRLDLLVSGSVSYTP